MIVADCTVIARLVIPHPDANAVRALRAADSEWFAPPLWEAEFASALRKYERAGILLSPDSDAYGERALELLERTTHSVSLTRVLDTSRRTTCTAYDSHYIALAEDLGAKLYTYDEEILRKCPRIARRP